MIFISLFEDIFCFKLDYVCIMKMRLNLVLLVAVLIWIWNTHILFGVENFGSGFFRICQSWEWNKQWVLHTILCTQKAASLFNKLRLGGGGAMSKNFPYTMICIKNQMKNWNQIKWMFWSMIFYLHHQQFTVHCTLYSLHYVPHRPDFSTPETK